MRISPSRRQRIEAGPRGLWYRRIIGRSRMVPWSSVERVVSLQGDGRRRAKVIAGKKKIQFGEAMTNYERLLDTIAAKSGRDLEGSTVRLGQAGENFFYGYQGKMMTPDRLYLVYVGDRGFATSQTVAFLSSTRWRANK